jgi:hypothetical protein
MATGGARSVSSDSALSGVSESEGRPCGVNVPECQILPLPISRYRFKFQSNLVWDSIKSISNFCFQF